MCLSAVHTYASFCFSEMPHDHELVLWLEHNTLCVVVVLLFGNQGGTQHRSVHFADETWT